MCVFWNVVSARACASGSPPNTASKTPGGSEGAAEVGVDLAGLGGQVTGADQVAVNVFGFLAGDEHHPGSGRDDDVGVGGGSGQVFGVDELECHRASVLG